MNDEVSAALIAQLDQTAAAHRTHAHLLKSFRDSLMAVGFDAEQAQELVVIWYDQALTTAAMRTVGDP